jgi:hypothetical protein
MRFEKGRSGNPGGRRKGDGEIRELARRHTATALATLAEICANGENESARVAAANALLDRGWGKPAVPVVASEVPERITLNFGRDLRPRQAAIEDAEHPMEDVTPKLLPAPDDEWD